MLQTAHIEQHFGGSETVRDIVIGMSDGLTVPFALAAGLSGAITTTSIIVTAGLAEIAAGSIAMGLGGDMSAKSDSEHYLAERAREELEVRVTPDMEAAEVADIFQSYGLTAEESSPIVDAMRKRPQAWVDFMMRFELGLEKPNPRRAVISAGTIAGAYIAGGFIPLFPYIVSRTANTALIISVIITLSALAGFGYIKGRFTGTHPFRSAIQTLLIGGLAATAAFIIARVIS
jgi:VIT1/CCC1 family predicted Fe2+/Mn2+ transporter